MKKVIITTGIVAVAGGIATVLLMPSCDPQCEVESKPSVIVQFVGEPGEHAGIHYVAADEVTYDWTTIDGTKLTKQAECGDEECNDWLLGDGQSGTFEVRATVCGEQVSKTVTVDLNDGGCEVDTQIVQVPVNAAACTDIRAPEKDPIPANLELKSGKTCTLEARPSIMATVVHRLDDMMIPVNTDRAYFTWDGAESERARNATCLNEGCSQFAVGLEQAGEFMIGVEVCGKTTTRQVTVGMTHDECHVDTQWIMLEADVSGCTTPPVYQAPQTPEPPQAPGCVPELWPSAIILPVTDGGDVYLPHPTDNLVYIHDGRRGEGHCAEPADNGKCRMWIAGYGQTGRFRAFTETCERKTEVTYTVEMGADGCHPKTEFLPVFVDTTGCITAPTPGGPSGPETPPTAGDVSAP